ncbi:mucin-3A isoform X5 [Pieris napi]|uniref:mucin-3A isoform X5 n=1 Tax=Pieris napi TaxID=78633 RepID=UPI001FBB618E|nr:mucin-3A isoform X5 [Pieris napi]
MDQRRAAAALFALAACFACATAAPTASNQTALDLFEAPVEGCYYNFQHYGEGDRIMTNEPCLNCTCHNRMLMCYLRVCPFTKPIGQDCTVEKRADQCCPIVTCPDVPVDLLTSTSTSSPAEYGATGLGKMDKYGCSINGKYFPEGAKVPPTPNKPCEHCYCIHNMTTCVMQECTLHVDGCTPIYHKDVCCPIRYSCDHAEDEIPLLDDMTTTVRPTPGFLLTTTTMMPVTQASQNCVHDDKIFFDGALIKTEKACEHCYCMKGDIVCVVQECGTPMENEGKNCTSLPPKQGQCCPDTYICEGDELSTTQFNEETTTLTPPRRFGVEGSGYRNEPDESYTEMSSIGDTEIEGSGEDNLLTTITSLYSDTPPVTSHNVYPYSTEINPVSSEVTTQSDIENENKVLTTEPSVSITSTNTNDLKEDTDEEKGWNVMTTVVPSGQPAYTTSVEDLKQKQDTSKDISTTKSSDQYTTLEPTVTPKLNEISEGITEITTKQSLLDDVDNMTPIDEEFIIATKLPEKTDDIDNSFEEPLTTFKPANVEESITEQESSETTPKIMTFTEQQTYSTVTTSSLETTTINVQENEILEETLPARIPGEGDCLLGGVTFKNNTSVPSTNKCHISCKCVSSIIKCDPIICTPPLEYMENMNDCQPIYDSPDSCCPTYVCNTKETIAPESHSQMSGTEIPKPIECVGDECRINQESKTTENPVEHACGENGCQGTEPSVLPQNDLNDCSNGNCDSKKEQTPVSDTQPCDATTGCQVPVIKPCVGENCITKPVVPTDIQDKFETNNKPCNNENECQVPVITPCIGDDCIIDSKLPNNKETDVLDKETKDEENTCTDENCRRKEYDETNANVPCSGTDCTQQETVSPNDVTSPESIQPIPTTKPDQAKQPEDFTLSEPRSTLEPFIETTVPSITTSSEIKHTVETIREESTTQTYLVDEGLISHQPDRHSEADKPSTEPSVPDIETVTSSIFDLSTVKEHLVIATEQATTEYSSKPSDENIMHTTLGASLDEINSPSTTEMADKTEIRTEAVSKENTKDTYNMLTEYPKLESTTADTMVSSQSDKESNQNEFIHVTGPPNVDETTSSEILEEEKITIAPHLSSSISYDDKSSDTTESELSFTKEIPDLDLSVQPISHVTGAPDFISEHPTTEQKENYPSTLTPEAFTKNADEPTHPEIYAMSTEVSKKEEDDSVSPDVPTVTEAQVIEEATEIFNKEGTTFQPESHKQSEPEITSPSTIEQHQTQKAIDKDILEFFTEVSPAITTEFNQNDSQKDQSEIEQVDLTSTDKQETQTKIPEIKYTEVTQDFTTALNENPTENNTSDMRKDIEQNTEILATIAPLIEDEKITTSAESIESNESPSENPVVHKETTTLRVNEPSGYTTSKPIEDTYTNKFEKTTESFVNLGGDKINTTPSYNKHNDISEETTIISLPNISESVSELVTDIATENYYTKDTHKVTEPSNESDKTDKEHYTESDKTVTEQSTGSPNESDKTGTEQSTEPSDESDKTVTEKSTGSPNESDKTVTESSNESDKTDKEHYTESDKTVTESDKTVTESSNESDKTDTEHYTESDKTVTEQSTGSPNESDKTDKEQYTESDKSVTEQSTGSPNESDKTDKEQYTESDKTVTEQSTGSPNESDKTDKEHYTESDKTVTEQSTGSPNESDKTGTEQSTEPSDESDKTVTESSNELDKTGTEQSTEPSDESDKTVTESSNESDKTDKEHYTESDKTVTEQSTGSPHESDKTDREQYTESDKTVTEQSTGSPNESDKTDKEDYTESDKTVTEPSTGSPSESDKTDKKYYTESDKTVTEQSTGSPNVSDKVGTEQSSEPSDESDKTVIEKSTGTPNESDNSVTEKSTEPSDVSDKTVTEPSNESDKTGTEQSTGSPNESDKSVTEQSTGSPNESDETVTEQSNESDKTDKEQYTESDKTVTEQSTGSPNESDKTDKEHYTESDKTVTEQSTGSPNESDKTDKEHYTESDKTVTEQSTGSPNESDKTDKEHYTESDKTVTEQSTGSPNESDKTGTEQSTEMTGSPNEFDKTDTEQSTKSSNELVDNEIGQSTESMKESTPEILVTDEIKEDKMTISNTDKPNTTLLDEPVDTMKPHESTESSVNNDLGQTHGIEIVKLPSTLPNIIPEVLDTEKTFVSTSESTFDPESGLSSTASSIAVELEHETKAFTDSSETQEKQTLSPMSLITEKPHTVTESVTENLQTIAVTKTKESELTTGVEITTAGKDLLTTKQNADTVTPSIESTSRIKDSDVTTESPKEETTSKTSQSLDESVLGAITEQPGTTFNELTTRSEIEMTSSSITQKTEAQVDVSTKPSVLTSETHDATDYPILIEEKTKQPELFTTELIIESTKKSDQITEQPLSISTDPQEITMSTVDEHRLSNSQDEISTTVVVENEPEKFTKAPELPEITNDADTIQEETPKQEIDSTKYRDPEGSTETSYETHTKPTTVKEETFSPTQHDILSQDTTDKTLSTESLQSVTPEQTATKSPIENTRLDSISSTLTDTTGLSTEHALADKIDIQEATTESKYEYSETTPYFVELEEHTHQIMQETSIIPIDESSTERATGIQSTERGDQPLSDNLGNGLQTEKSTDVTVTPLGYSQETTLSNIDVYTTTASEISSSSEPQKDTEVREQDKLEPTDEGIESTVSPTQTSSMIQNEDNLASTPLETKIPDLEITATTEKSHTVMNEEAQKPDVLSETKIPDQFTKTTTPHYVHEEITSVKTTLFDEKLLETSSTTSKPITTKPDDQPTEEIPSPEFPPSGVSGYGQEPDYGEEEQAVIPGICRYGGKVYGSTQQIPRDDPCDFCFCFRSDIICLQQSCPPPIHGCREEPIQGFCCPRYECPVSMATTLNVTTTTTTTTTTLPPHFLPHAYKGAAQRRGCHIKGHTYKVGEVVRASSGPCLHCTCGGDGQMKCDPKACTPEPMLRQMIAAAVSARRR